MLKRLKEYQRYLEITGFRNIEVRDAKAAAQSLNRLLDGGCEVQLFDADLVATWEHLYFAVVNSFVAFRSKTNVCKSFSVETVLYASGQRQIQKAIDLIGVTPTAKNVAILLICGKLSSAKKGLDYAIEMFGKTSDESVLELSDDKIRNIKRVFDISKDEIAATSQRISDNRVLIDLIIERMALLSTRL